MIRQKIKIIKIKNNAMKIPNKLNIFGIEYSVNNVSEMEGGDFLGKSWTKNCEIKIDKNLKQDRYEKVFFHELIHLILDEGSFCDESKNEQLVDCLANGLYQVLKNNNLLK